MYLQLALDNTGGINSFAQFATMIGLPTVVIVFLVFLIYLLPAVIISSSIKKVAYMNDLPRFIAVKRSNSSYFVLEYGIRIHRKYAVKDKELYDTPYGIFDPVYDGDNIIGFMYSKK